VFAKNAKDGEMWRIKTPNCRADTLLEKIRTKQHSLFKSVVNNPCVILLDGYFEYHTLPDKKTKIPYYITMKDCAAIPVAGFTSSWRDFAEPERVYTGVTMCTIGANPLMSWVHNMPKSSEDLRMPGILLPSEMKQWLDTSIKAEDRLEMIKPYPTEEMEAYTVINFKKKEHRTVEANALAPFDYEMPGIPTHIDGANLSGLLSTGAQELFS
jgi:putative SOS response-associated peptidase YedK